MREVAGFWSATAPAVPAVMRHSAGDESPLCIPAPWQPWRLLRADCLCSSCLQLSSTGLCLIRVCLFFHPAVSFKMIVRPYFRKSKYIMPLLKGCESTCFGLGKGPAGVWSASLGAALCLAELLALLRVPAWPHLGGGASVEGGKD